MDKETLRERVWDELEESGVARFPFPPHGRIPNFAGAKDAADRLTDQPEWEKAETIKANPDAPQLPVRRAALRAGKTVYMAVPRLADEQCFLVLDPDELEDYDAATTVSGSSEYGTQVGPEAVGKLDLIVSGSVAVTDDGGRVGKGEGYSDLEYAMLYELGLVDEETPVATTVHERQVFERGGDGDRSQDSVDLTFDAHDVSMDLIVTPERVLRPDAGTTEPAGIDWDRLEDERLEEMPVLKRLSP
ncbi:5-formyltetrahydrofolate cyclo-ligase [Halobiforma nitratireducens]|uniref:5-formyltetrahydrofolate cyclo-ligase n=1 Tax=Halobiforma nitratireducens JCM 10879 TaxID=1227454 RepID=M0LY01_9EURY|nr:5-formyltetrahydrofolate cyclo-ligase [Halobiforma nitratireducens]EMA38331.1 5-formyltetrahydrofolate cyclo-ligase [Halobiforma nitratireducens JCM 10879]